MILQNERYKTLSIQCMNLIESRKGEKLTVVSKGKLFTPSFESYKVVKHNTILPFGKYDNIICLGGIYTAGLVYFYQKQKEYIQLNVENMLTYKPSIQGDSTIRYTVFLPENYYEDFDTSLVNACYPFPVSNASLLAGLMYAPTCDNGFPRNLVDCVNAVSIHVNFLSTQSVDIPPTHKHVYDLLLSDLFVTDNSTSNHSVLSRIQIMIEKIEHEAKVNGHHVNNVVVNYMELLRILKGESVDGKNNVLKEASLRKTVMG